MPRAGGESGKLGDRYEAVWTVDSLLDVLSGDAVSIEVEPFDRSESLGIEFKKVLPDSEEFHSAKRQTTGQLWSISALMRAGENGRSVLGDLLLKLDQFSSSRVVFVSGTTARDLEEICEAADKSHDALAFQKRTDTFSEMLRKKFEDNLLRPHFKGSFTDAWAALARIRVVGWTESEMIRRVDQRIRTALYRTDTASLDATSVRCLIAEMIFDHFGQRIERQVIIDFLGKHGVAERDWSRERGPREIVETRNAAYTGHVEAELIANERIPRTEAEQAAEALLRGGKKRAVVIGAAGLGKSCAVAQTLVHLRREGIPHLALRLDLQTKVLTSRRLGEELGLPESPVLVLAGIANGGRSVLVLDQLDAISFASGRNQSLWDVFEEMLSEAQTYPQMRVLLACRSFDAEHDPRLRRLLADTGNTERIELSRLPLATVNQLVRGHAGIDPGTLDSVHLELLRAPLHLSLYLQSDPCQHPQFRGVQDLFSRYWSHKQLLVTRQLGRESRWHDIVQRLVERLSRDQTLSASRTLLDPFDETEISAMASQNVIVLDGDSVRFFHEAFFDYCCARLFVEQGRTLLEFLIEGGREQHLFRRAQVRQILEYEREHDSAFYFRDLGELLTTAQVRYHLKKLAIDWLGGLTTPEKEEWTLLESLDPSTPIGIRARRVPWGHPAWVKLLDRLRVWEQWLESPDTETVSVAVRMLSLPDAMKVCSVEIARLFRPYVEGQKAWREEFSELFCFGVSHFSREIFELLLDAIRLGRIGAPSRHDWSRYESLATLKPDYAVELLAVILNLQVAAKGDENNETKCEISARFIHEAAQRAPIAFAREMMPRMIKELGDRPLPDSQGTSHRRFCRRLSLPASDPSKALEEGLETSLRVLAREHMEILDTLTLTAEGISQQDFSRLLLSVWSENGVHYASKIVNYLLRESERFGLGFQMWATGNGFAAIGRGAVRSASPHCSLDDYARLEAAIMCCIPLRERKDVKRIGYQKMLLLECLPSDRISRKARLHFEELKRKFPWETFEMPGHEQTTGFVASSVPQEAATHMTDEQWLKAMRKYVTGRDRSGADFLKGGKHELSNLLRREAQTDKPRFAQLALAMDDSLPPEYFNAILTGITTTTQDTGESSKLTGSALESLDAQVASQVISRVYAIGAHGCAREICWAIKRVADEQSAVVLIQIVCHYAIHDPDPEKEEWQEMSGSDPTWGGDPHFHGMNSVRGAAAEALAALLFADKGCFAEIEDAVLSVVHDRSIAVRSCAILCLVAMLNFDRDRAVTLFLELCENADAVLDTHYSEQFIHHATYRNYEPMRSLLMRMLTAEDEGPRSIAGRQIVIAGFHDLSAAVDVAQVLAGDPVCRQAAAEIYAHHLGRIESRSVCAEHLAQLFVDPDSKVRAAASDCFRVLSPTQLTEEKNLMFQFIESAACLENSHYLFHALEECAEPLPEVICRVPERFIAEHRAQGNGQHIGVRRWTHELPALIARLYQQTPEAIIKSRCLDIIDAMLELGFSEIEKELAQVER